MNAFSIISGLFLVLSINSPAAEILENGDFRGKLHAWHFVHAAEYDGKIKDPLWTRGKGKKSSSVRIAVPWASTAFYVRLEQRDLELESKTLYRLTYELRGESKEGPMRVMVAQERNNKLRIAGLAMNVPITKKWTAVDLRFRTDELNSSAKPRLHLNFAAQRGYVEVRNVSLVPLKGDHPEPRANGTMTIAK